MKDYEKLLDSNLYFIFSPPRTGSTLLGRALSKASNIKAYCHEPCFNYIYFQRDPNLIYKAINETANSGNTIVKEMTHWAKDEFQNLIKLTKHPIVFLIRNPIIATESKIRRFLMTCDMREKESLNKFLIKFIGSKNEQMLNQFASFKGFKNWKEMISICFSNKDYNPFNEILSQEEVFSLFNLGWEPLIEQIKICKKENHPFLIVDNTDYRLFPEKITKEICKEWNLEYNEKMIKWEESNVSTNQEKDYQKIWYETLSKSKGVLPPSEIPIPINRFPKKMRNYLIEIALPAYLDLYGSNEKISVNIYNKKVIVPYNSIAIETLKKQRINPAIANLKKLGLFVEKPEELIFDNDDSDSSGVWMSVSDMDKIYWRAQEELDTYDNLGNKIGKAKRATVHSRGYWHKSVHVWIFNNNKLLIQKRSSDTETSPGFWTISASGHVKSGEEPLDCAIQEVHEELGINLKDLRFYKEYKKSKKYPNLIDNEFNPIFIAHTNISKFYPNEEVAEVKFIELAKLKELIEKNQIKFKPDNKAYHKILFSFQN